MKARNRGIFLEEVPRFADLLLEPVGHMLMNL